MTVTLTNSASKPVPRTRSSSLPIDHDSRGLVQVREELFGKNDRHEIALESEVLVGHIFFSRVLIESPNRFVAAARLSPVAVAPNHQGRGNGSALIREALVRCADLIWEPHSSSETRSTTPVRIPNGGPSWLLPPRYPWPLFAGRGNPEGGLAHVPARSPSCSVRRNRARLGPGPPCGLRAWQSSAPPLGGKSLPGDVASDSAAERARPM